MDTFAGYFMPGIFCLILGLRWTYCSFYRYFLCWREQASATGTPQRYRSSVTFPVSWCPTLPIEAGAMLAFVAMASIWELVPAIRLGFFQNSMPLTMYSFYGMAATLILLKHFGLPVVPDADYACFIVSFLVNVFVVQRHAAGKSTVDIQAHQNMMLVMFATAVVMALEMRYRRNPLLPLFRAVCFELNGSWLMMTGYLLYSPWGAWSPEDPKSITMTSISFVGHIAGNLQLAGLIGGIALARVRSLSPEEVSLALDREGLDQRGEMGHKISSSSDQNVYQLVNSDDEV